MSILRDSGRYKNCPLTCRPGLQPEWAVPQVPVQRQGQYGRRAVLSSEQGPATVYSFVRISTLLPTYTVQPETLPYRTLYLYCTGTEFYRAVFRFRSHMNPHSICVLDLESGFAFGTRICIWNF
jgi:hypothetical protein